MRNKANNYKKVNNNNLTSNNTKFRPNYLAAIILLLIIIYGPKVLGEVMSKLLPSLYEMVGIYMIPSDYEGTASALFAILALFFGFMIFLCISLPNDHFNLIKKSIILIRKEGIRKAVPTSSKILIPVGFFLLFFNVFFNTQIKDSKLYINKMLITRQVKFEEIASINSGIENVSESKGKNGNVIRQAYSYQKIYVLLKDGSEIVIWRKPWNNKDYDMKSINNFANESKKYNIKTDIEFDTYFEKFLKESGW